MKAQVNKIGYGNIWGFRPCTAASEAKMHTLFRGSWVDGTLFVEHRYEIEVARRLVRAGFTLTRAEDDVEIEVKDGTFVVKRRAA